MIFHGGKNKSFLSDSRLGDDFQWNDKIFVLSYLIESVLAQR